MRSIRGSLVFYFLALMALALGAVGFLIDRVAGRTLAEREIAACKVIDQQYDQLAKEKKEQFDAELNLNVNRIASELQLKYYQLSANQMDHYRTMIYYAQFGALSGMGNPVPIASPWWHMIPFSQRMQAPVARSFFSRLNLQELPGIDDHSNDFIQVVVQSSPEQSREQMRSYKSKSLEGESWEAPIAKFEPSRLIDERFETRPMSSGAVVRVAEMKTPLFIMVRPTTGRFPFFQPSRGPRSERPDPPPPRSDPETVSQVPVRTAFIQYGRNYSTLETRLVELEQMRNTDKDAEVAATSRDRRNLRTWLGLVGVLTFAGLIGGGLLLVKRGLKPLDTLSDAVAKVSEKDFHLPVDRQALSHELLPIHDRLTETLNQLQQAFEHDRQAVADISHELRTPVAALLATLDVSLRKPREAEQYKQTIVECRAITKNLQNLVERVMLLAALDAAPKVAVASDVDAVALAEGCAAMIRPLAEAHGLTLSVNAQPPVKLRTDGDKLREVLMNLLHNAVEYNRPGGIVELSVSNGSDRAVLAVKDTGIGMTDNVKSRIFERFYRADPSRTHTGLHAGLGLAIVKECVDRLGGKISVESAPGEGSQFKVELPV